MNKKKPIKKSIDNINIELVNDFKQELKELKNNQVLESLDDLKNGNIIEL